MFALAMCHSQDTHSDEIHNADDGGAVNRASNPVRKWYVRQANIQVSEA